jgi:Predicted membrane protein (DUF2207)
VIDMRALTALFLLAAFAAPATAKSYSAERFDSTIRILPDGALEVTETVVFRFEDGTFTYVVRDLPTRRTDGIEIVSAEMDGRQMPFGGESGQVEVRRRSKIHVRWRFAPRSGSTHTFVLKYVARGVVQKTPAGDLLEWTALPTEHKYRIDSGEVVVDAPAPIAGRPAIETRRVGDARMEPAERRVRAFATNIGKDGWVRVRVEFADGAIIAAAPAWQQRQQAARALAPSWATAAGVILTVGLIFLVGLRQQYDSPRKDTGFPKSSRLDTPPDDLRPAVAGAVASNGSVSAEHAMAALFSLADRGIITITEEPRRWGQRQFALHRAATGPALAEEESVLLSIAFRGRKGDEESVSLDSARSRIQRHLSKFREPVRRELGALGLFDQDRMQVRARYLVVAGTLLVLALVLVASAAYVSRTYGGWPFLIPAAVAAVAVAGFIFYGALTPLSNEGVRRAERWRAYQRYLKEVAADRAQLLRESPAQLLPFAVALGLAAAWSKYVKQHPQLVPAWFQALASAGDDGGFPAFIATGGAAHGGGGGGGGAGGAAGGGGSGAG